ncbi:unnamed protein product, partial [Musa banksii]
KLKSRYEGDCFETLVIASLFGRKHQTKPPHLRLHSSRTLAKAFETRHRSKHNLIPSPNRPFLQIQYIHRQPRPWPSHKRPGPPLSSRYTAPAPPREHQARPDLDVVIEAETRLVLVDPSDGQALALAHRRRRRRRPTRQRAGPGQRRSPYQLPEVVIARDRPRRREAVVCRCHRGTMLHVVSEGVEAAHVHVARPAQHSERRLHAAPEPARRAHD